MIYIIYRYINNNYNNNVYWFKSLIYIYICNNIKYILIYQYIYNIYIYI